MKHAVLLRQDLFDLLQTAQVRVEHVIVQLYVIVETISLYRFAPSLVTLAVVKMTVGEVLPVDYIRRSLTFIWTCCGQTTTVRHMQKG